MNDMTLYEALNACGYTTERVVRQDGEFFGVRILKDGKQVHDTVIAKHGFGWDLVHASQSMPHVE